MSANCQTVPYSNSSAQHDNQPLTFVLGAERSMTPGFQIGVVGMKVGGERLITIPPPLGYGNQNVKDSTGKVVIPANSTLVFDIKLVQVQAYYTSLYNTSNILVSPVLHELAQLKQREFRSVSDAGGVVSTVSGTK